MRRALALAVAAVLCCAACSATAAQTPPSSSTTPSSTHVSAPASTPAPTPARTTPRVAGPTAPAVPADVPRTGPNTRPGEKPPVMPVLATQHTAAGARAFAEFFIKTIDWGYATTSSTYMRHYFEKTCIQCRNVQLFLNTARNKGDHYLGGRIVVVDAATRRLSATARGDAEVDMHVNISASEILNRLGHAKSQDIAYNSLSEVASLKWLPAGWTVVALDSRT